MNPTIRDVAKAAGVGLGTVSRVLNNSGYVRPETRERVLQTCEELGFVPNQVARSLVRRLTATVGLIVPDITNPFFPSITRGVEDAASDGGYTVFLCNADNDPAMEAVDVRKLRERWVDGIIFVGTTDRRELVSGLLADGVPVVVTDRMLDELDVDSVVVNNTLGARDAVLHLIDLGHRRIAHAAGPQSTRTGQDRRAGYRQALQEAAIPDAQSLVVFGEYTVEGGYHTAQVLLGRSPRPTAIFAGNDLMALGIMRAADEAGIAVPDELSVVGFDDIQMAGLMHPGLTTVRQPAYEMGRLAMTMLQERIAGQAAPAARRHVFQPELVVRGTTRRPPGA